MFTIYNLVVRLNQNNMRLKDVRITGVRQATKIEPHKYQTFWSQHKIKTCKNSSFCLKLIASQLPFPFPDYWTEYHQFITNRTFIFRLRGEWPLQSIKWQSHKCRRIRSYCFSSITNNTKLTFLLTGYFPYLESQLLISLVKFTT